MPTYQSVHILPPFEELDKGSLQRRISMAILGGHIWPAFQPLVDMRSGEVAGFEILARWSDPEIGDISPLTFIPLLERHGLIDILTDVLLRQACKTAASWPDRFFLAFNLSPLQLVQKELAERVVAIARESGFDPERLQVEVTEGSLMPDKDAAFATLTALVDHGMTISIDDFGTGYSNLERLSSFPFRKLKIDARFVRDMDRDASKRRIVASLIGLGHSLGMGIVAEGVETPEEANILRELGCDLGQGWLYSKAEPAEHALALLIARGGRKEASPPLDISPFQQLHQLDSLYNHAPVGLCFMDLSLRHVRANDRFASIHGLTAAELEGKPIEAVMSQEMQDRVRDVLERTGSSDATEAQEYRLRGRDILILSHRVADVGGEVIGFSIVSIDVTEQNKSRYTASVHDEHFRHTAELGPNICWAATPEGVIDYMSHTSADHESLTPRQHVERWIEQIHPEDRGWLARYWLQWAPTGAPYRADFRVLWADGRYHWVSSRALAHRDETGRIIRWYGITLDITWHKELEERLDTLEKALGADTLHAHLAAMRET